MIRINCGIIKLIIIGCFITLPTAQCTEHEKAKTEHDLRQLTLLIGEHNFDSQVERHIAWVKEKTYIKRLADDIADGRLNFISVYRHSEQTPGLLISQSCLPREFGRRLINIGDGLISDGQIELSKIAEPFAENYNRLLAVWIEQERGYGCAPNENDNP